MEICTVSILTLKMVRKNQKQSVYDVRFENERKSFCFFSF